MPPKVIVVSRGRPHVRVHLDGDGCWKDLNDKTVYQTVKMELASLSAGMAGGRPSVALRIDLTDDVVVMAECSLDLFEDTIRAFRVHLGQLGRPEPDDKVN